MVPTYTNPRPPRPTKEKEKEKLKGKNEKSFETTGDSEKKKG